MKRLVIFGTVVLAGCATSTVQQTTADAVRDARGRIGIKANMNATAQQRAGAKAAADALLAKPLSQDDALRIALTHSPATQALLFDNMAQQSAAIQGGRIGNPVFTFERLVRGGDKDIGRMLSIGLLDVVMLPWRMQIADAQLAQARLGMVADIVSTASTVRQAWVEAVAAQQSLAYFGDVQSAAEASAELARRMQSVGNFSKLQQAREQAFYADAATQLARAQHARLVTRERLVRLLGLDESQASQLKLPDRLPDLPKAPQDESEIARTAFAQRLDVQMARAAAETAARTKGFTTLASWLGNVHLGVQRNSETGQALQRGFEIEVPLPIFDAGDARRTGANAAVLAIVNRLQQVAVDARSQTAVSYHAYRTAYDIARHYRDEIVPLRKFIADENVYRYNGMLIGVFDLLADARAQIGSVIAAIDAQRDFWLADAALQSALIGKPVDMNTMPAKAVAAGDGGDH
jgi:hypothetical protein